MMYALDISIGEGLIRATPKCLSNRTGGALISLRASGLPGSDSTSRPNLGQVPLHSAVMMEYYLEIIHLFVTARCKGVACEFLFIAYFSWISQSCHSGYIDYDYPVEFSLSWPVSTANCGMSSTSHLTRREIYFLLYRNTQISRTAFVASVTVPISVN
jgi:hypothetical protein